MGYLRDSLNYLKYEKNYPKAQFLAEGAFGVAFDIGDNKVAKITENRIEVEDVENHLIGKNIEGLVNYHKTEPIDSKYLDKRFDRWLIIMDKANPLIKTDMVLLQEGIKDIETYLRGIIKDFMWWDFHDKLASKIGNVDNLIHNEHFKKIMSSVDQRLSPESNKRKIKLIYLYVKTAIKLVKQRILHIDPHEGNVGWDPYGNFVFFDYTTKRQFE